MAGKHKYLVTTNAETGAIESVELIGSAGELVPVDARVVLGVASLAAPRSEVTPESSAPGVFLAPESSAPGVFVAPESSVPGVFLAPEAPAVSARCS